MVDSVAYHRELEEKQAAYSFLGSLFLTLPDEKLVESLIKAAPSKSVEDVGLRDVERYARERRDHPIEETVVDLAKDRVHLMRGVNANEIRPPYESLYIDGASSQGVLGSLNRFYAENGCNLAEEVKESPDQIGVEFSFVAQLMAMELEALDAGDDARAEKLESVRQSFMSQHLSRWAYEYAKAMKTSARTGFYRGVAVMIMEAA